MFQFPGFASPLREMIGLAADRVAPFGNPGITACLQLPRLIAAYHVLRRLPVPRHPPCALTRLISLLSVSRCDSSTPHTPLVSCQRTKTADGRAWKVRATNPVPFAPRPYGPGLLGSPERQ